MWTVITNNWTKILGGLVTLIGAVQTALTTGMLEGLVSAQGQKWVALLTFLLGAAITGVGFNNSTKEKVAQAMQTAILASPPNPQSIAPPGGQP